MSYTTADLTSINKAIANGAKRVQFGDRMREYRSMDELREAKRLIEADLGGDTSPRRVYAVRTGTRKAIA